MKKVFFTLGILFALLIFVIVFSIRKEIVTPISVPVLPVTETPTTSIATIPVPTIDVLPKKIIPGDPIYITIDATSSPIKLLYDKKPIETFSYNGKQHALVGIDFNEKILKHTIKAVWLDGSISTTSITITPRPKVEAPLGIPEKLGGNTPQAASQLLTNLAKENNILNTVQSSTTLLWDTTFAYPLKSIFVTDDYGYDRLTVNSTIVHKGTDFRATEGTAVYAMNDGVVKIARLFTVYGNSVVIDHGLGVQTLYMHMSKLQVKDGQLVERGDLIGYSGSTGYAESPHLHLSIKINGISIDPMVFLGFFK